MCGINGIFSKDLGNKNTQEKIDIMNRLILHRGPDNSSSYINDFIAMGHNRLSILDTSSAGDQPFYDEGHVLSYNGEIYNFLELRNDYFNNKKFNSGSDTELLFSLLVKNKVEKVLSLIKGMFAFSYYNKEHKTLYLCRDRLGIKPLYWAKHDNEIIFSSEIKSIHAIINSELDHLRTLHSLAISPEETSQSLFNGINSVPQGCYVKIKIGHAPQIIKYYDIAKQIDKNYYNELNDMSLDNVSEHISQLMKKSTNSMLMSDVPLGAFVSGGIDSSLIASLISDKDNISLFSSDVNDEHTEILKAREIGQFLNLKLLESKYLSSYIIDDLVDCVYHMEVPLSTHINSLPLSRLALLAKDNNIKPVLTGEGADELFLGYPYALLDKYRNLLISPVNFVKSAYGIIPRLKNILFPNTSITPRFIIEELLIRNKKTEFSNELMEAYSFLDKKDLPLTIKTGMDLNFHLSTLLHRNDRMGMMHSIESRFPFLDEDLIKVGLNLPVKWKIKYGITYFDKYHPFIKDKFILRHIAKNRIPTNISNAPKRGFPINIKDRLRFKPKLFNDGYLSDILKFSKKESDMLLNMNNHYLLKLVTIEIFGRLFSLNFSVRDTKDFLKNNMYFSNA